MVGLDSLDSLCKVSSLTRSAVPLQARQQSSLKRIFGSSNTPSMERPNPDG